MHVDNKTPQHALRMLANLRFGSRIGSKSQSSIVQSISNKGGVFSPGRHISGIEIRTGRILAGDQLLTTTGSKQALDYVVGLDGNLYIGRSHEALAAISGNKQAVQAAGTLIVKRGKITQITNKSGHFLPSVDETMKFPELFRQLDLDIKGAKLQIWVPTDAGGGGRLLRTIDLK